MTSEFPINLLPITLREAALTVSRATRTPIEYAAAIVLAAQSAALGKSVSIEFQGRRCRPNLFMVVIGGSGTGKSSTFRPLLHPFFAKQKEIEENWKDEILPKLKVKEDRLIRKLRNLKDDCADEEECDSETIIKLETTEREIGKIKDQLRTVPRLICEDTTQEKLAEILHTSSETIFLASADAVSVIDNLLGKYSNGSTDASIYLKMYTGDPIVVDRMSRGSLFISDPCGTVLLFTTPDQSERISENDSLLRGGLLSRASLLTVSFEDLPIPQSVESISEDTLFLYQLHITTCIENYLLKSDKILILQLRDDESEQVRMAINRNIAQIGSLPENIKPVLRRYPELLQKLIICFHFGAEGADMMNHQIGTETIKNAIKLADFLQAEHLKLFEDFKQKEETKLLKRSLRVFSALFLGNKSQPTKVLPSHLTRSVGSAKRIFANSIDAESLLELASEAAFLIKTLNTSGYPDYSVTSKEFASIQAYLHSR